MFEEIDTAFKPLKKGRTKEEEESNDSDGESDDEDNSEAEPMLGSDGKPIYREPAFKVSFNGRFQIFDDNLIGPCSGFLNALDGCVAQEGRLVRLYCSSSNVVADV